MFDRGRTTPTGAPHRAALLLSFLLVADTDWVMAGIGNLGRSVDKGAGGTIETTVNPTFVEPVDPNELISDARTNLVARINLDPMFEAQSVTDPNDPTANSFSVFLRGGVDVTRLQVCSSDPNIDHVGVAFPVVGRMFARLAPVTQVPSGDGSYSGQVDTKNGPDCTFSFSTDPNDTAATLNTRIQAELINCGLDVSVDAAGFFVISRPADQIEALRVESDDSGLESFCVELSSPDSGGIPTVSQYGILVMVVGMTGIAMWMLRRRRHTGAHVH